MNHCKHHPCMCKTTRADWIEKFRQMTSGLFSVDELKEVYKLIYRGTDE